MEDLAAVKRNFLEIKEVRNQIKGLLESLHSKIEKLKHLYVEFISRNQRNLDIFGLDSFHFQNKMLEIEYQHMMSYFNLISNRMYGGYYKLYHLVIEYAKKNIDDKAVLDACQIGKKSFPVYKDLEPSRSYDFDIVLDVHHTIIQIITEMENYLTSKAEELKTDKARSDNGLNIENFIHAFVYKNTLLSSQIQLFINYMSVFHKYHGKYLKRFRLKLLFMYKQIDSDVDLEQGINSSVIGTKKRISRRNSTDSSIINDMKDIVSGLGGTDGSPGSISPGELSEMKAVLDADRKKMIETHFSEGLGDARPSTAESLLSTSTIPASTRTVIDVPSDDVSEVTEVPSDDDDDSGDDVLKDIAAMKIAIQEKLVETSDVVAEQQFPESVESDVKEDGNTVIT